MLGIHEELKCCGHESQAAWARGRSSENETELTFNSQLGVYSHAARARVTDRVGFYSSLATRKLVDEIKRFGPDVVHLHNIHGYCLDVRVLFSYLKDADIQVVWTLHSCWPFTGHCTYFERIGCDRWKTHCFNCPQKSEFPKSVLIDASEKNFDEKKALFTSLNKLTVVTPSRWLAGLVQESFLSRYPVKVVRNGIDVSVFNNRIDGSAARGRCCVGDRKMILGVASPWSERKGFKDIIKLRSLLGDEYLIVLVGLSAKQLSSLPEGIVGFDRTDSTAELAELYAAADLFINPTHEDNYPTVNLEALACGTRVLTYNTGGSPECASCRDDCIITDECTPESMFAAIESFFSRASYRPISSTVKDQGECAAAYLSLYESQMDGRQADDVQERNQCR